MEKNVGDIHSCPHLMTPHIQEDLEYKKSLHELTMQVCVYGSGGESRIQTVKDTNQIFGKNLYILKFFEGIFIIL